MGTDKTRTFSDRFKVTKNHRPQYPANNPSNNPGLANRAVCLFYLAEVSGKLANRSLLRTDAAHLTSSGF